MIDTTARDALERWICSQLPACSHDELRILGVRLERMSKARSQYGELAIGTDTRDWRREAAEENVDRAFYADCLYIAKQDEERERLECEVADENAPIDQRLKTALAELRESEPRIQPRELFGFDMGSDE